MPWRYLGLTLILVTIPLGRFVALVTYRGPPVDMSLFTPPPHSDPEGRLAMGYPLPLACADPWSLELIKGISDTLAFELIEKRREILAAAAREPATSSLKRAHGVGDKVAPKLLRYLSLTERCQDSNELKLFDPES